MHQVYIYGARPPIELRGAAGKTAAFDINIILPAVSGVISDVFA